MTVLATGGMNNQLFVGDENSQDIDRMYRRSFLEYAKNPTKEKVWFYTICSRVISPEKSWNYSFFFVFL